LTNQLPLNVLFEVTFERLDTVSKQYFTRSVCIIRTSTRSRCNHFDPSCKERLRIDFTIFSKSTSPSRLHCNTISSIFNTSTSTLALLRRLVSSITTATHYTSVLRRDSSLTYQTTWTAGQHERTAYRRQKHQKRWLRTTTTWQLTSRISH